MPRFTQSTPMQSRMLAGSAYGYSGTRLDALGAAEYTLVAIAADQSGSVHSFRRHIERCIAEIVQACQRSPRADNLMLRTLAFDDAVHEVHGFKPLPGLDPSSYRGSIQAGGCTALHDAALNAVGSVVSYGSTLGQRDFTVNGLVFVLTDGEDNASAASAGQVRLAVEQALASEVIESVQTVLVGVNVQDPAVASALMTFSAQAGFDDYIQIDKADAASLAQLASFATQSIAMSSTALANGLPVASLSF